MLLLPLEERTRPSIISVLLIENVLIVKNIDLKTYTCMQFIGVIVLWSYNVYELS